jgi:hypothetical protein
MRLVEFCDVYRIVVADVDAPKARDARLRRDHRQRLFSGTDHRNGAGGTRPFASVTTGAVLVDDLDDLFDVLQSSSSHQMGRIDR